MKSCLYKLISVASLLIILSFLSVSLAAAETPKELYDRGIMSGSKGRWSDASTFLKKASELAPDNMPISISLSISDDVVRGKITNKTGELLFNSISSGIIKNWESALSFAIKARDLAPEYALVYVHLGTVFVSMVLSDKGDRYGDDAIKAYKKALEIDPDYELAHYNIGVAYAAKHQWRLAHEHLTKASTLGIKVPSEMMMRVNKEIENLNKSNPSSSTVSNNDKKQKGFLSGLFAPLLFIVNALKILFSPGTFAFDQLWNETWGQGTTGYKIGFVVGAIIIFNIPIIIGSHSKK